MSATMNKSGGHGGDADVPSVGVNESNVMVKTVGDYSRNVLERSTIHNDKAAPYIYVCTGRR